MAIQASTLRPGLLVSLKTSLAGGIAYDKRVIQADRLTKEGTRKAKWETERTIENPEEFEEAAKVRQQARSVIGSLCAQTAFGWLCPEDRSNRLEEAIKEARQKTDDFNSKARDTCVYFYIITGRIAQDDVEAVRAINSEVRELIEEMTEGVKNLNAKSIRDAANRLRSLGQMITPNAQNRLAEAIETARATARQIVKAGETAAQEVDRTAIKALTETRRAFLDFDEDKKSVARPKASRRAVDLTPEKEHTVKKPKARQMALDLT